MAADERVKTADEVVSPEVLRRVYQEEAQRLVTLREAGRVVVPLHQRAGLRPRSDGRVSLEVTEQLTLPATTPTFRERIEDYGYTVTVEHLRDNPAPVWRVTDPAGWLVFVGAEVDVATWWRDDPLPF